MCRQTRLARAPLALLVVLALTPGAARAALTATAPPDRALIGPPVAPQTLRAAVTAGRRARTERSQHALLAAPVRPGALSGRRIAISPGHGRFFRWTYDSGAPAEFWDWQRGLTQELREDIHTNQLAIEYLIPLLERAGAEVVPVRERSFRLPELRLDNDDGAGTYGESGDWETSETPGWQGGTYRFAYSTPGGSAPAEARWSFTVAEAGDYPVSVWFLASRNRSRAARYRIEHAHGAATRVLDQGGLRVESFPPDDYPNEPPPSDTPGELNARWHYLGTFPFTPDAPGAIVLTSEGDDPETVVIADAVRVGADESGVVTGGETSGVPRWQEAAIVYLEAAGTPEWVRVGDVVARPLFAVYEGVDAYFALHTNCCEGTGTSIYTWYPEMWVAESAWEPGFATTGLPPGTYDWSDRILRGMVHAIRTNWDPDWRDRGHYGANFGELRVVQNAWTADQAEGIDPPTAIPAALVEAAFHDTEADALLIRERNWRHDVSRGIANGMIRYFAGRDDALVPPLPPAAVAAWGTADGVRVAWRRAPDPVEPDAVATAFRLYVSADPRVFPEVATRAVEAPGTATVAVDLAAAPCETLYVRVAAVNEAGESLPGPVVGARRPPAAEAVPALLWVDGVDREVRTVWDPATPREYARFWGPSLGAAADGAGFFAMASDDAVAEGLVALGDFAAVVWSVGETSRHDGSFLPAERAAVEAYLGESDARLAVSGAEIGWDLVDAPQGDSARFLPEVLHADYLADDADEAAVSGSPDGPFADFESVDFGLCESDTYCVEWPDVLGPRDGGAVVLTYAATGDGAAVEYRGAGRQVLVFGFPLETVTDPATRHDLLRALAEALVPEWWEAAPDCTPPPPPDPGPEPVAEPAADVAGGADAGRDGGGASDAPVGDDAVARPDAGTPGRDAPPVGSDDAPGGRDAATGVDGAADAAAGGGGGGGDSGCAAGGRPATGPWWALVALGLLLGGARATTPRPRWRRRRRPS